MARLSYAFSMKTMTIRLPEVLIQEIEKESRVRKVSRSDVVRERLILKKTDSGSMRELIGDLVGAVKGLPSQHSANKKKYLAEIIRTKKTHRR